MAGVRCPFVLVHLLFLVAVDVEVDALLKQLHLLAFSLLHGLQPDLEALVQSLLILKRLDHHQRVKNLLELAILLESLDWHFMLRLTLL